VRSLFDVVCQLGSAPLVITALTGVVHDRKSANNQHCDSGDNNEYGSSHRNLD
jgi:hypothetical protein